MSRASIVRGARQSHPWPKVAEDGALRGASDLLMLGAGCVPAAAALLMDLASAGRCVESRCLWLRPLL